MLFRNETSNFYFICRFSEATEIKPVKTARQKHIIVVNLLKDFQMILCLLVKLSCFFFLREQIRNSKNEEKL